MAKSTSKIDKKGLSKTDSTGLSEKEKKNIESGKDKTSANVNTKAPPIKHPHGGKDDVGPTPLKEKSKIRVKFDDKKILEKALRLADLQEKWEILDEKKRAAAADYANQLAAIETEMSETSAVIRARGEEVEVLCEIVRNFTTGNREYWYGGVKYKEEKLRQNDHQLDLLAAEKHNASGKMTVVNPIKYKAGDWIETEKGVIIELTEDDLLTLQPQRIKGYASQAAIDKAIAARKKK